MALSKKHFEQTAANFKHTLDEANATYEGSALWAATNVLRNAASQMAASFAQENARFDRSRFMAACGFTN